MVAKYWLLHEMCCDNVDHAIQLTPYPVNISTF